MDGVDITVNISNQAIEAVVVAILMITFMICVYHITMKGGSNGSKNRSGR